MIRPYTSEDKAELIELLKLNIPQFFDPSEEDDFIEYLNEKLEDYFVVEEGKQIVGAGGINYLTGSSEVRISWDIIHPNFHGRGIGKRLVQHRLDRIGNIPSIERIVVRTSQLAYKFYEKCGFQLIYVEKDYWAKGFDLYEMRIE